jgi:hypothetical protein
MIMVASKIMIKENPKKVKCAAEGSISQFWVTPVGEKALYDSGPFD